MAHAPLVQLAVPLAAPHTFAQRPQLAVVVRSASQPFAALLSQSPCVASHRIPQTPVPTASGAQNATPPVLSHAAPHAPQWAGLVVVFTHEPPQSVCVALHEARHTPLLHTVPLAQARSPAVPHAPQWARSLMVSTSQPLAATPSQSAKPAAHAPRAHAPAAQVALALANAHRIPQPPQWFTSVAVVAVSHPLEAVPSQSPKPGAQVMAQVPFAQLGVPFVATQMRGAPDVEHAPQFAGSLSTSTHAPLQSTRPAGQAQTPAVHSCPGAQAVLHAPQKFAFV